MLKDLTIGELAKQAACKVQTIRFYEQIGLLALPFRTTGNQRRYGQESVKRLQFIRHARDMGFEIGDIRELLELAADPAKKCHTADKIAQQHLASVRDRIRQLKRLEKELVRITENCTRKSIAECRVIEALSDHGKCKSKKH